MPNYRILGLFDRAGILSDHIDSKDGPGNIDCSLFGDGFISGAYNGHTIYAYLKVYNPEFFIWKVLKTKQLSE